MPTTLLMPQKRSNSRSHTSENFIEGRIDRKEIFSSGDTMTKRAISDR